MRPHPRNNAATRPSASVSRVALPGEPPVFAALVTQSHLGERPEPTKSSSSKMRLLASEMASASSGWSRSWKVVPMISSGVHPSADSTVGAIQRTIRSGPDMYTMSRHSPPEGENAPWSPRGAAGARRRSVASRQLPTRPMILPCSSCNGLNRRGDPDVLSRPVPCPGTP